MRIILRVLAFLGVGVLGAITIHNVTAGLQVNVSSSVAVFVVTWVVYGWAFSEELFGIRDKGYAFNNLFGYLVVRDYLEKSVTLDDGRNRISVRVEGNALKMKQIFPVEGEEKHVQLYDYELINVQVSAGKFVVNRIYGGYKITWIDGKKWKLIKN